MGMFGQLGALFWKNILIRRRHPAYIVLEVVWPVVLFVVLVLMRLGSPPDHRETCEYQDRDLPSAGLMPFLQSSVCTLNNNCSTRDWVKDKAEAQQRFQALIQDLNPLINKETTVEALKALPTVTKVLENIKDVAGSSTVEELDEKLLLKNLFRDPDEVVTILSDKYRILNRLIAEALLDASLNPIAFVTSIGTIDFKKIVCDPHELERFIILSDKNNRYIVNKFSVSTSLCQIPDDMISDVINELIHQLDVANIVRLGKDLANMTGSVDVAQLMSDLADLTDMFMSSSDLLSMVEVMPDLTFIPQVMREFGKLLPLLDNMMDIDMKQISALLDFVGPMISSLSEDKEMVKLLQSMINSTQEILSSMDLSMDFDTLMRELPNLISSTNLLESSSSALGLPMAPPPINEINMFMEMIMSGEFKMEDLTTMSLNDTFDYVEVMMRSMIGEDSTDLMMAMATNVMEMMTEYTTYTNNVEEDLKGVVSSSDAVVESLNTLYELGEDVTSNVLSEMLTMENVYGLIRQETSTLDLCQNAVRVTYKSKPDTDTEPIVTSICTSEATQVVDQVFVKNNYTELTIKLINHMTEMEVMMSGTIPPEQNMMELKVMYTTMMDMITDMLETNTDDEWMEVLKDTNIDVTSFLGDLNRVDEGYKIQTLVMMPVLVIGEASEKSPMWKSAFSPVMEMVDATVHEAMRRVHMIEEIDSKDMVLTKMFKYLPYYPEIIKSAVGTNVTMLINAAMANDSTEVTNLVCNHTHWDDINMLYGDSVDELKQFMCETDPTDLFWDVFDVVNIIEFMAKVEEEFDQNIQSGIDWSRMARNIQYLYSTLNGDNSLADIFNSVPTNDLSWIDSYYSVFYDSLTEMTTDGASSSDMGLDESFQSLDTALQSWDLWKRVKHYTRTWNLLAKILNKYAPLFNDPSWNITSYLTDMSPTLGNFLSEVTDTMPEVIDALEATAQKPELLADRLTGLNFADFCGDSASLSLILGIQNTPQLIELQNDLCSLDWSTIMSEIETSDIILGTFIKQWEMIMTYNTTSLPEITLNWTDIVSTTQLFAENVNSGMFNQFMPGLSSFGLNDVNSSISDLSSVLQNTWNFDVNKVAGSIDILMDLLYNIDSENDTYVMTWQYAMASNTYVNYHLYKFFNTHLGIINRTGVFDLSAHLNSPQAIKVLELLEQTPEFNDVLLLNLQTLTNGLPAEWLSVNIGDLCNNRQQFESLIKMPVNTTLSRAEVVDAVCAVVDIDKLVEELRAGMEGLDDLIIAMENITSGSMSVSDMMVTYTTMAPLIQNYMDLLEDLITAPIRSVGLPLSKDGDLEKIQHQFEQFLTDLGSDMNTANPTQFLQFNSSQTLQMLNDLEDIPMMSELLQISHMYVTVLRAMVTDTTDMQLDPSVGFADYPEMYKMWQLMDMLPELYAVFMYTSMVDNAKILRFTDALIGGTETFCSESPYNLMTDPPILNIRFEKIFNHFCSVNFDLLEQEASAFIHAENISSTYDSLSNQTTISVQDWMTEFNLLLADLDKFTANFDNFKTPGFDNMTLWEEIMSFLDTLSNVYDPMQLLELSQNQTAQNLQGLLDDPGMSGILHVAETYMIVLTAILDKSGEMLADPMVGFADYPEMYKMWKFMDWLPQLYTVFTYTSLVDNNKISYFFENLIQGPEVLCMKKSEDLMTDPPIMNISFELIFDDFCDINMSALEVEMSTFIHAEQIGDAYDTLRSNSTNQTGLEGWLKANEDLTNAISNFANRSGEFKMPDFYNETLWIHLMQFLEDVLLKNNAMDLISDTSNNLMQVLASVSPDFHLQLKITDISYDVMEMLLDRLDNITDNNLADVFYGYGEIQKLVLLLQEPHVMEMLAYSVNTPKFTSLLTSNDMDAVIDEMCKSDLSKYFTVPPSVTLDLKYVQEKFCAIDLDTLVKQMSDMTMVDYIINKISDNYTVDWMTLNERNEDITARLEALIMNPPMVKLPSHWSNETFWIELLILLNGPQSMPSGDPSMEEFLKHLESYLGEEYKSLIEAWVPVAVQLDMTLEARKAFATVDLVLDFMIVELKEISDNVTVENLSKNSTDVIKMMEALGELRNALTSQKNSYNESVDPEKLVLILSDHNMLRQECEADTVSNFISMNGTENVITQALGEIICFDPDTWQQVLEDQTQMEELENKLMNIWNVSNTDLTLNWTSLAHKMETFVYLLMNWNEAPPSVDNQLLQWTNWDGALGFLNTLYLDPNLLSDLLPMFGINTEVILSINKFIVPFMNELLSGDVEEIFSDPEKFLSTMDSLTSIDELFSVLSTVIETLVSENKLSREELLTSFVCGSSEYEAYRNDLIWINLDVTILCGREFSMWNETMMNYRYNETDIGTVNQVFNTVVKMYENDFMVSQGTMDVVKSVLEGLNIDMFVDGTYWVDWLLTLTQDGLARDGFMALLKLMEDTGSLSDFRSTLLVIVETEKYIDMMLNNITGNNSVPLVDILPDPDAVATLVADSGMISTLLMSSVDPAKFLTLMLSNEWNETVCNMTLFLETFSFHGDVNVTSLQHELCSNVNTHQNYLAELAKSIDIGSLLMKVEDILRSDNASISFETYNYMSNLLGQIIEKMTHLGQVDTYGMDAWSQTMLDTLQTLMDSPDDSLERTCNQVFTNLPEISGLTEYLNSVDGFIKISSAVMKIQIDVNTAVCGSDSSDVEGVLDKLEELGVVNELTTVTKILSGETTKFSCDSVPSYVNFFVQLISSLTTAVEESYKLEDCVTSAVSNAESLLMDISKLFSTGSEIIQILENEDLQNFLSQLIGTNISTSVLDDVIDIYNQQENAVRELMEGLENNMTEISSTLQTIFASSTESILSSLNMTYLQNSVNLTVEELIESVCQKGDFATIDLELNKTLCGENQQLAKEVARTLLNYSTTLESLQNMAEYDSMSFWNRVSQDISALAGNIEGLASIASLAEKLGTVDFYNLEQDQEILQLLQEILVDNGPDAFLDSLNNLIETFSLIDNDNITNALLHDVKMLADGIFAFSSLKSLALTNVHITDLVKDPSYMKTYMMDTLAIPEDVSDAILDGSISMEVLISAAQVNVSDWVCNSTRLATVLKFDNDSITNAEEISEAFCKIDVDTVSSLVGELALQLDIGGFVEDIILNSDKLFRSNISMEETKEAIKKLVDANEDLNTMTQSFNDFAETIPQAFENLAVAQTSRQEFGSFSAIVCGTQIPMIRDEFNTGSVMKETSELSDKQKEELNSLPGNACKDMYMKIMQDKNGAIIWAYLKPLMRGKILYSPRSPVVDRIIKQINSSFESLEEVVDIALSWAEGSVSLVNISGDKSKDIQEILKSNLIQGMMTELAGVSANSLDDILYTLENTDMDMMSGISKIADMIQSYISCVLLDRFEGFDDESSMEMSAKKLSDNNELLAGLVFDVTEGGTTRKKRDTTSDLPHHIHYSIRMDIDNVPTSDRIQDRMWRPQPYDQFFTEMRYFRGFVQLQDMVDQAIISLHGNVSVSPVTTKQLPYPCHTYDVFVNTIAGYLLNVIMTLSWLAAISFAVFNLVYDRERGQEETLAAMGMKTRLNWIAWFFTTVLIMALVAIIDVLLLRYGNIFSRSNIAIVYLYFLDFVFSTIMLSYFLSAFFTRTSLAILATVIGYVVSYLPFVVLFTLEVKMKFWHKTLACLSSTTAFSYAAQFIARYEEQNIGLQWDNVNSDPLYDDGFSFSWCCIMIAIDGVIYLILGWYVRSIKPGKFGVAEPWYFIFSPKFWCNIGGSSATNRYAPSNDGLFVESTNNPSPVVLSTRGLSKTYSDGTQAVTNLNLDIHAGNVTTLLGHNGAAKTTTMNMMIGILQPTEGDIFISNQPLKSMKGSLGVCSQHNALYDYMTVQEHMELYSSIKGSFHGTSAKDEIRKLLKEVDLWMCRDKLVKNLSGGMQRRLCVALAFVGGSRAVILDEPTSGVDPSGRRAIWNLITQRKNDSAVLLSTHHLDEADIISDQIAVIHGGHMLCIGSPMFLKHHLASGHRLTVIKRDFENDSTPILSLIKSWIPGARLQQTAGTELTFVLPAVKDSDFYALFQDLESQSADLNVVSYGVSDPKLEEVFLKVCSAADSGVNVSPEALKQLDDKLEESDANQDSKINMDVTGANMHKMKREKASSSVFTALLAKRFHHYRRDWRIMLSVLLLPLILVLLASGLYKVRPGSSLYPKIYLSPAMYGPDSYAFVQQHSNLGLGESVMKSFMTEPGFSTSCMKNMPDREPYKCVTPDSGFSVPDFDKNVTSGKCACDDHRYKCEGSPYGIPPKQMVTTTTDILQDLRGRDVVEYLLDSYPEFKQNRFGGWSFADEQDGNMRKLKATIWYNNQGYHALPAFFNAYSNGLLRSVVSDDAESYGISTYSHPFVFSEEPLSKDTIIKHAADMGIATIILLAFTFIPVGVLMYSVNEFVNKEKHMQFVNGVTALSYWMASLLWDLFVLGVAVGVSVLILLIFRPASFWDKENLEATVCLLALYGWSTITFVYMLSKRFRTSGAAFFTVFCTLMFIGLITILLVFSFKFFYSDQSNDTMGKVHDVLKYVFLVFPPYALGGGLLSLIENQMNTLIYDRFNLDVYQSPFTFDMIGWNLFAMGIEGFIFFVLTVWMDLKFCCSSIRAYDSNVTDNEDDCDEDVELEKRRIDHGDCKQDTVFVRNLHKVFDMKQREVHAVNGLSFGVQQGQCFGLLGINGAGKSTTFNILTGMLHSTNGSAYIMGKKIERGTSTLDDELGYCPQSDALDPYLSILNTLNFHVKLKHLSTDAGKRAVENVMTKLELHGIKNKLVKSCSGGMKRRLSLAIALLGDPAVVLLDEPTSGMDPKAKRLVWNCLLEAKQKGQSIILTSHSLEECDVLCDRIGIMVNGQFKCLGSSQHLKQKYGDGYTVMLYLDSVPPPSHDIHEFVKTHFPHASVTEQHVNVVQLDIPKHSVRVADVFSVLEQEKSDYNIVYYTVSQTTLDTIFLNFAREQTDGDEYVDSDKHSSDTDSDSTPSAVSNPFYKRLNPALDGPTDKGKTRPESMHESSSPYILPAKNTFVESKPESYSIRL